MPPIYAKKPSVIKKTAEMCAHGGPVQCDMGCYSKGGRVHDEDFDRARETGHEKGVHYTNHEGRGNSPAGSFAKSAVRGNTSLSKEELNQSAKGEHHRVLGEIRTMKGPHGNYAEGGDVEPLDEPMEDSDHEEIESVLAEELLSAMEKKDKKGVVSAIEALVLQCMNKGGM